MEIFKSNLDIYFADYEIKYFEDFLNDDAKNDPYFVVLQKGEVIGCGGFSFEDNVAKLNWGMVKKEYHKLGVGEKLLKYRLKRIKECYPNILVEIETSQHTQGFFEKYDFTVTKNEKNGFEAGLDRVSMRYES